MYIILISFLLIVMFYLYQRYFPIWYVPRMDVAKVNYGNNIVYLDVRDYQDASHKPVQGAFNLPYAYLKRHHDQITSCEVVVVASDPVLKNLSIRFLKGHGFKVVGYQLIK
ncbi:sulfurtransferase (plasmid) [Anaerobacillus sp. CMMVII]|uniref:sulfurtransferase n=1 Tax=Anaerobacillus sp. CMMVII TaxID=2755588 RepID=UPI0021B7A51B|nr:sulfurtransferase [Anaerobacillus sp. CMMVII]MCT8139214.1 sulfurtransferase [Anaerobacillus sp. CMMVII]